MTTNTNAASVAAVIACVLAELDGYDPKDQHCGLYDMRWSGGPNPEPEGDAWHMDYLPKAERIAAALASPGAVADSTADAARILSRVCDLFHIGKLARTESTILTNVRNVIRFTGMLNAVEHDLFPAPDLPEDEDDDPYTSADEGPPVPNRWGARDDADYVAQFRAALAARGAILATEGAVAAPSVHKQIAAAITRRVAELPDRNSPEDWPEAMLVTADELSMIVTEELQHTGAVAAEPTLTDAAPSALSKLTAALVADPEYAWSWHCNLAMPIMDSTKVSHRYANIAAARLMQHIFGIDTAKHVHFELSAEPETKVNSALADWAASRWHDEVANRPLVNIHRRSLDGTWRQVLRYAGADDRVRLGPTHDELVAFQHPRSEP